MSWDSHIRSDPFKGFFCSLVGTVLFSIAYVIAKYGLEGFNQETFSLVWASAAAIYSLAIVLATSGWQQLTLPAHAVSTIALIGLLTGAGMILSWAGLARLDPSFAGFLWRFAPVLTIVLGALYLGERLLVGELVPIAIMVLGGCLGAIGRWHIVGVGMALTLLACCAFAVQLLIAKMQVARIHSVILNFYRVGIGALIIALWTLLTGKVDFNVEASYWLVTLLGAFLGPCTGFLLTFRSYRHWDLSRSSIVLTVQPLFILPSAYFIIGQLPTGMELIGGSMILAGAFWLAWIHR